MCELDIETRRALDLERYHRRTAERRARGLCLKCGKRPPAPERSICEPCAEKTNRASRARDARLRAAGLPRRDPEHARERSRRQAEAQRAAGLCPACGKVPATEGLTLCEPCNEKRRARERARYARAMSEGKLYGGRPVETRRRIGRERSRKRDEARRAAGLCTSCGTRPPVEGGATCEPCRITRRESEREAYTARRAAGQCVWCAGPVNDGGSRCAPCAVLESERRDRERRNARSRELYWERRARSECTSCGAPSPGASQCAPCAERSYHGSSYFRGMPAWDPSFTVIELASGETLGTFDSEAAGGSELLAELGLDAGAVRDALADDLARRCPDREVPTDRR